MKSPVTAVQIKRRWVLPVALNREVRGDSRFLPSLTYLPAMSPLGLGLHRTAANDNWPTASGPGWLAVWWPVLAVLMLPPLITAIGVVIAIM
jgi:hypothetical protein